MVRYSSATTSQRRRGTSAAAAAAVAMMMMIQLLFSSSCRRTKTTQQTLTRSFVVGAWTTTTTTSTRRRISRATWLDRSQNDQNLPRFLVDSSFRRSLSSKTTRLPAAAPADDEPPSFNNQNDNKMTGKSPARQQRRRSNKNKKNKHKGNTTANSDEQADKLAAAFDEMARKEGFDDSLSYYADDATFRDDFDDAYLNDFDLDDALDSNTKNKQDFVLDPATFHLQDFTDDGGDDNSRKSKEQYKMEQRIAAAQKDMVSGRVSVPQELDDFADSGIDLSVLGYQPEDDPWGHDETHRKVTIQLVTDAMACSACGADFQCSNPGRPGYLPSEKFAHQVKLSKIEELQRLQRKAEAENEEWTPEDEVEYLIQTADKNNSEKSDPQQSVADIDVVAIAEEIGIDLTQDQSSNKVICQRCHGLQNYGRVEDALRPGWTEEPLLSQEKFRDLLRPIREKPAVIVALVDLFDFAGSVLPELDSIAGDNPVILAANKADLLPSKMGKFRVENWVRRELEYMGIQSLANVGGAVQLVSCKTGMGVPGMLDKARQLAEEMDCDIYVIGAANAGKSTLLNHILWKSSDDGEKEKKGKVRSGNKNKLKGAVTTSPLPGTTLKFIKIDMGGRNLYDTPGLLVPGTLTQMLTPEELKIVVPKKQVEPITFHIKAGKTVLVGGLARVELLEPSRPFFFTFFVANEIKLHPTNAERVDDILKEHVGKMLMPPLAPERMEQLGEFESHIIDIEGTGWREAAADITLTGLGWVTVTGAGMARVKITVPKGIGVMLRPPLMPFDIQDSTAKYTGGRAVRKTAKTKRGKRRKGVGRN